MHRVLVAAALLARIPVALAAPPPFPLGVYSSNPNGNSPSAEAHFESEFNWFSKLMGARPQFMDAFTDFGQDPSLWPGNAGWTAWSWAKSPVVGRTMTPIIGIPMADNKSWNHQDRFFKGIVAGTYDADYRGIVDAWAKMGFKTLYLRFGYEFNGGFMPWYCGNDATTRADWVAAFRHLAVLTRQAATADRITVKTVWNPVQISWTSFDVHGLYPGDQYVDVVAVDVYSPEYPLDLTNWATGATSRSASFLQWSSYAVNRRHFWNFPSAQSYHPTGQRFVGWSLLDTIHLATARNKPVGIAETGAGGNGRTNGPSDDPAFPEWLAATLSQPAVPKVEFVVIWDDHLSDGNWDFSSVDATKPQEAASWSRIFGAN